MSDERRHQIGPDLTVSASRLRRPPPPAAPSTCRTQRRTRVAALPPRRRRASTWSTNTSLDASDQSNWQSICPARSLGGASASFTHDAHGSGDGGRRDVLPDCSDRCALAQVPETTETTTRGQAPRSRWAQTLIVTAVSVPSSGAAGGTIAATDSTKNQGAGPATASSTGFYLSVNATISPDDGFIGSRSVGELAANGTSTGQAFLQIPADTLPGSYYVVARTDWNGTIGETSETNNDKSGGLIRIGGDLLLTSVSASSPVMAGGPSQSPRPPRIKAPHRSANQRRLSICRSTAFMTRPIDFLETAPWAHCQPQRPVRCRHRSSFQQEQRPEAIRHWRRRRQQRSRRKPRKQQHAQQRRCVRRTRPDGERFNMAVLRSCRQQHKCHRHDEE